MKKQSALLLVLLVGFSFIFASLNLLSQNNPEVLPERGQIEEEAVLTAQANDLGSWLAAVQESIRRTEYDIVWQEEAGAYQAPNRQHNLRTFFTEDGLFIEPRDQAFADQWRWGMHLARFGNEETAVQVKTAVMSTRQNRIELQRDEITEWYINDARGLEQGFTIHTPLFTTAGPVYLDLALAGDLIPTFSQANQAIQFETAVGNPAFRYSELRVFDATGSELAAEMQLLQDETRHYFIRLLFDTEDATYPITVDPIIVNPFWTSSLLDDTNPQDGNFGFSVDGAGDINGDGYADVIVGANWYDNGAPDTGAAFVYHGSDSGLSQTPDVRLDINIARAEFGYDVSSAGDVNSDGYDDLIVGAPFFTNTFQSEGATFVYYGSSSGVTNGEDWKATGAQSSAYFGLSVATAGDVNNDGYDDVIIGAPNFDGGQDQGQGRAFVYHGSSSGLATTPDWMAESDISSAFFGVSVATAGDVNKDTFDDVIIGADNYNFGQSAEGIAVLFHGANSGLPDPSGTGIVTVPDADTILAGGQPGSAFGHAVNSVGDFNDDGYDDVIVGAPFFDDSLSPYLQEGAAFIFEGSAAGVFSSYNTLLAGSSDFSKFGYAVSSAGDFTGDGLDDVIVGAPEHANQQPPAAQGVTPIGAAFLHDAADGVISFSPIISWTGQPNSKFGTSVGTAGDVNADGNDDVIVGAPEYPVSNITGQTFAYFGVGFFNIVTATNDSPTLVGEPTTFVGETDGGGFLNYDWDFGDGAMASGQIVTHIYTDPGIYTATLIAQNPFTSLSTTTRVSVTTNWDPIDPGTGGSFSFTDSSGKGVDLEVPPGAVNEAGVRLAYTPLEGISEPPPANACGYFFDLDTIDPQRLYLPIVFNSSSTTTTTSSTAVEVAAATGEQRNSSFMFLQPIEITVNYNDANAAACTNETELKLFYWDEDAMAWLDAATTCTPTSSYSYDPANNRFTVEVCHFTRFGMIGAN